MLLLIDKPKGMTSHDVVDKIREITGERKVGHGGTLDPNATGLLIIGVSREGTKRLGEFTKGRNKEYIAEIFLGEEREGDDVEGKIVDQGNQDNLVNREEIEETLKSFIGEQEQVPPAHSAVKIKGKKAYELARRGKSVNLSPRKIVIYSIDLLDYDYPILKIKTIVSSGTYIRSLARDIGRELGTYGYLKNLRRTKVGSFEVSDAVTLDKLNSENWKKYIIK